jgi:hypothetical protein
LQFEVDEFSRSGKLVVGGGLSFESLQRSPPQIFPSVNNTLVFDFHHVSFFTQHRHSNYLDFKFPAPKQALQIPKNSTCSSTPFFYLSTHRSLIPLPLENWSTGNHLPGAPAIAKHKLYNRYLESLQRPPLFPSLAFQPHQSSQYPPSFSSLHTQTIAPQALAHPSNHNEAMKERVTPIRKRHLYHFLPFHKSRQESLRLVF